VNDKTIHTLAKSRDGGHELTITTLKVNIDLSQVNYNQESATRVTKIKFEKPTCVDLPNLKWIFKTFCNVAELRINYLAAMRSNQLQHDEAFGMFLTELSKTVGVVKQLKKLKIFCKASATPTQRSIPHGPYTQLKWVLDCIELKACPNLELIKIRSGIPFYLANGDTLQQQSLHMNILLLLTEKHKGHYEKIYKSLYCQFKERDTSYQPSTEIQNVLFQNLARCDRIRVIPNVEADWKVFTDSIGSILHNLGYTQAKRNEVIRLLQYSVNRNG